MGLQVLQQAQKRAIGEELARQKEKIKALLNVELVNKDCKNKKEIEEGGGWGKGWKEALEQYY